MGVEWWFAFSPSRQYHSHYQAIHYCVERGGPLYSRSACPFQWWVSGSHPIGRVRDTFEQTKREMCIYPPLGGDMAELSGG